MPADQPLFRRLPFYYGWVIVGVSLVNLLVVYGVWYSFPVFYVNILETFGWSRAGTASIFTVGAVVYGLGSLAAGALVDRFGPRRLFPAACLIIAVGCLISSLATQRWHFYVAYGVFMGFGVICAGFVPNAAVVSNWFVRKRGMALGICLVGNVAPPLLAAPIQVLISLVGWRRSYLVMAAILLLVIAPLTALLMRTQPRDLGLEPDGLAGGEAVNPAAKKPGFSIQVIDRQWAQTEWDLGKAVRTFPFWYMEGVLLTLGLATGVIMQHMVALVVDVGLTVQMGAFIFSLAGLVAVGGRLSGFLADRIGRELAFVLVTCMFMASAAALLILLGNGQSWPLYIYAVAFGVGSGLGSPAISAGTADLFSGRSFGAILGFINIGYGIGQGLGAWFGGVIFDHTGSYSAAILATIPIFFLMGLFFWLAAPRKVRKVVRIDS